MATERVELLAVARDLTESLDLPPIGSKDPVYYLAPPGPHIRLELARRPGLAEALIQVLAEHLETLPSRPRALYLTSSYASMTPGYGGHRSYTIGWYDEINPYDHTPVSLLARAIRLNDRLLAAPGMSGREAR